MGFDAESGAKLAHVGVSVIIPSHCKPLECDHVLNAIGCQSLLPEEAILVRASNVPNGESGYWNPWRECLAQKGVTLKVVEAKSTLFPGAARNLGLQHAAKQWVALLDVQTIPHEHWLDEQIKRIEAANSMGSFGSTIYAASSFKQRIVRDAIYGRRPIQTLPGSVLRKNLFSLVGQFIPNIRAAEDTEWMIRAKAMGVEIIESSREAQISYNGLTRLGFRGLTKKWRRNYLSSRQLQHLKVQTIVVYLAVYVVGSLVAFNWNALVAGWQVESPFYLDHVTKIVSLTPLFLYIIFRGLYIPLIKGVPVMHLIPFRFILLASVGGLLDAVKVSAIFLSKKN